MPPGGVHPMAAKAVLHYIRHVKHRSLDRVRVVSQLKLIVADLFRIDLLVPEDIADDAPLAGGSPGLDSIDLVELALCVEEEFGIAIRGDGEARKAFSSISNLADFIQTQTVILQARPLHAAESPATSATRRLPAGPFARRPLAEFA
jgi:acyl carrier protein